jgi:hypothetical protein
VRAVITTHLAEEGLARDSLDVTLSLRIMEYVRALAFVNADSARQFEFVQSQWVNDGNFVAAGSAEDPSPETTVATANSATPPIQYADTLPSYPVS